MADSGQLQTNAALNYEAKAEYAVTVTAANDAEESASIDVAISVTNVEEPGVVRVSSAEPSALAALVATLSDPDGGITDRVWSWQRSSNNTLWTTIIDATSSSYTPTTDDVGHYLRVSVRYADGQGPGKLAQWQWTAAVAPERPPAFSEGSAATRAVNENTAAQGKTSADPCERPDIG